MALGDSVVGICNTALIALREQPIASLNDATKAAALCASEYDKVRRAVLRDHPWGCAKMRAALPASATAPLSTYSYDYPLPVNYLRLIDLPDLTSPEWTIEGRSILANADAPLNILYISDLTDPSMFDALLARHIAFALAYAIGPSLVQSEEILARVQQETQRIADSSKLITSQEASVREWDEDIWLRARQ